MLPREALSRGAHFLSTYKGRKVVTHSSAKSETNRVFWLAPQGTKKKPNKISHNKNLCPVFELINTGSLLSYLIIPEFGALSLQKGNPSTSLGEAGGHPAPRDLQRAGKPEL